MLILLFVLGAVAMRFMPHAWNFTPVIAMLLLAGVFMKSKQLWIPVAALVASDFALNIWVYRTPGGWDQYFTWASYLVVLALAYVALRGRDSAATGKWIAALAGTTVASSALFFVISNFGVWIAGEMYPHTLSGLITCYAMGIPFYRNAAVGDLLYAGAFFGLYALIQHRQFAHAAAA